MLIFILIILVISTIEIQVKTSPVEESKNVSTDQEQSYKKLLKNFSVNTSETDTKNSRTGRGSDQNNNVEYEYESDDDNANSENNSTTSQIKPSVETDSNMKNLKQDQQYVDEKEDESDLFDSTEQGILTVDSTADNVPNSEESFNAGGFVELTITKTLLNGSIEDIKKLSQQDIIPELPSINRIKMSLNKKLAVWEIIKDRKPVYVLTRADLESAGSLLLAIPEMDLYGLNYSNWDIVDYLGTLPGLSRRQAGVVGYALKRRYGENIIRNVKYVNRIKGLLCAFSPQELLTITPDEFCSIGRDVFKNIRSCTKRQLQVLLRTAMLSTVYGPTQAWSMNDTEKLALLVASLSEEDLKSLRPEAMEGLDSSTIEAMPREKLLALNEDQISYLNDLSLAALRRIIGINSNDGQTTIDAKHIIIVLTCFYFWCFVI